jgi:hypothetical protein
MSLVYKRSLAFIWSYCAVAQIWYYCYHFSQKKWKELQSLFLLLHLNICKMWYLGSFKNSKNIWNLQTRFDCVCTWGVIKKCNIPHAPSTDLSGTQFSTIKSAGPNLFIEQLLAFYLLKWQCCYKNAWVLKKTYNWIQWYMKQSVVNKTYWLFK